MSIVRVYACMCAHTYAYMGIVRVHACKAACVCMHARCADAYLNVFVYMGVAWVRVRMFACAGVFARVRAHAYVFMRGCVCTCVVGSTCPRVLHVCALAPVCVVYMCMRVLAWVRAHESVSALMRKCACICVWAYADMCIYKMHKHINAAREGGILLPTVPSVHDRYS